MTAEELRQITKAYLINTQYIAYIDDELVKNAKKGSYNCECYFRGSSGYTESITKLQYDELKNHYLGLGFFVEDTEPGKDGKYKTIKVSWEDPETYKKQTSETQANTDKSNCE